MFRPCMYLRGFFGKLRDECEAEEVQSRCDGKYPATKEVVVSRRGLQHSRCEGVRRNCDPADLVMWDVRLRVSGELVC